MDEAAQIAEIMVNDEGEPDGQQATSADRFADALGQAVELLDGRFSHSRQLVGLFAQRVKI